MLNFLDIRLDILQVMVMECNMIPLWALLVIGPGFAIVFDL